MLTNIIFIVFAYLAGSLSSAIIVAKIAGLDDPRSTGSNNPGATNILRIGGKKLAALVLVGDALKGFIPTFIASFFVSSSFWLGIVGLAAVIGHILPLFFRFNGGKGVATAFGVLLALSPLVFLVSVACWVATAYLSGFSSLAALCALIIAPFANLVLAHPEFFLPLVIQAIIICYTHRGNIQRLRAGSEPKIGKRL